MTLSLSVNRRSLSSLRYNPGLLRRLLVPSLMTTIQKKGLELIVSPPQILNSLIRRARLVTVKLQGLSVNLSLQL